MRITFKKLAILLIASVLVMISLGGCSGNSKSAVSDNAGAEDQLQVIRIMGIDRVQSMDNGQVKLSDWVKKGSPVYQKLVDDLKERGLKLELDLIPEDQYQTVLQTKMAAGLNYDFMNISKLDDQTIYNLVDQGRFQPINTIIDKSTEGTAKTFFGSGDGAFARKLATMDNGNFYWLANITTGQYKDQPAGSSLSMSIRKDWLEKVGLPMPKTTDEFYNALKTFQDEDVNNSGAKDEVIKASLDGYDGDINQWFGLGANMTFYDKASDKVTSPWYQATMKDYIAYMKKLNDAGLLEIGGQESKKNIENKLAATSDYTVETWYEPVIALPADAKPAVFAPVGPVTAVPGVDPLIRAQATHQVSNYRFAVTKDANQEAIAKLFDYLASPEYVELTEWGIEGVTFDLKDGVYTKTTETDDGRTMQNSRTAMWVFGILPRFELSVDRELELKQLIDLGFKEKADFQLMSFTYPHLTMSDSNSVFATPTVDEIQKMNRITTDLETYTKELLTKLILGQKSLEEWDSYLSDLKRLGLDEKIAIDQERYDRFMKN
jgi:ABC-type glycerol-3-phosphate transport system substrate-binding protein